MASVMTDSATNHAGAGTGAAPAVVSQSIADTVITHRRRQDRVAATRPDIDAGTGKALPRWDGQVGLPGEKMMAATARRDAGQCRWDFPVLGDQLMP